MREALRIAGLALTAVAVAGASTPQQLARILQTRWQGKEYYLRGFPAVNRYSTDATGQPLKSLPWASWTVSEIRISDVKVNDHEIEVDGKHLVVLYEDKTEKMVTQEWKHGPEVRVDVRCDPAGMNEVAIARLESGLFLRNLSELAANAPSYWHHFLTDPAPAPSPVDNSLATPPRPLFQPDPGYSAAARDLHIQGTTLVDCEVTAAGAVTDVSIARPIGAGMDEEAVAAVSRWRFKPALDSGGKPRAMLAEVLVNFKLFNR